MPIGYIPSLIFNILLIIIAIVVVFRSELRSLRNYIRKKDFSSFTWEAEEYINSSIRNAKQQIEVKDKEEQQLPKRLQKAIDRANNGTL